MKPHLNAFLFTLAIVISAIILGNSFVKKYRPAGEISVTGLGEKDFTSDLIVWEGYFSKVNSNLKQASAELSHDKKLIEDYLLKNGIDKKEIVFNAIEITELTRNIYTSDRQYIGQELTGYKLTQSLQITSKNVENIEELSRNITDLINEGIQFYSNPPRYYYTKLSDLKIKLISEATEDARERAEKIAEKSGSSLGKLISAQMGIFQITGQNSDEEYSWGGTFNTSSKEKTASITMKLIYKVR